MKKRYTEGQIIGFLREADGGIVVKELCRKHGFSEPSYYAWRSKFDGIEIANAKKLKALEIENTKVKKLLADAMLENEVAKEALRKNGDHTASSGVRAVGTNEGIVGAPRTVDRRNER